MTGVHAATRSGLGYALLLAGADGLSRVRSGPLAEGIDTPVWLVARERHRELIAPLHAAAWRALRSAALAEAA